MNEIAIRALTRAELNEVLNNLGAVDQAMQALPFRDYLGPSKLLTDAVEILKETLPGGHSDASQCDGCGNWIGLPEVAVWDSENGLDFCAHCAPSPEELGWIDWSGGERPTQDPAEAVEVRTRNGGGDRNIGPAHVYRWSAMGLDDDIVAYRVFGDAELYRFTQSPAAIGRLVPRFENRREPGEFGEGATVAVTSDSEGEPAALEAKRQATSPYIGDPIAEEIQLLKQLRNAGGFIDTRQRGTQRLATRLNEKGFASINSHDGTYRVAIKDAGRAYLIEEIGE